VTVLVGENGSGKSTLVAALAAAWRGRLTGAEVTHWGPVWTPDDEGRPGYTDLFRHLVLDTERPPLATHSPLLAAAPGADRAGADR
jgi:predicted ATPase